MSVISRDASCSVFSPRAILDGAILPKDFQLPTVESVEGDARTLSDFLTSGQAPIPERVVFVSERTNDAGALSYGPDTNHDNGALPESLAWNLTLPNLFKFAYFCHPEDVPGDLLDPVIWALKMLLRVLTECSDEQLSACGHMSRGQDAERTKQFMTTNARNKLCMLLLDSAVDRPAEAIPYLKEVIDQTLHTAIRIDPRQSETARRKFVESPWFYNPLVYSMLSDAKVWSGHFNEDVKITLERVIEAGEKGESGIIVKSQLAQCLLKAKVNLVRVLQQMGKPETEYKRIEDWAVTYIRKNPSLLLPGILVQLLGRPLQTPHPVLVRLGGEHWLKKRIDAALVRPRGIATHLCSGRDGTRKHPSVDEAIKTLASRTKRPSIRQEERTVVQCRQCGAREPTKKLFKCSGCKYIYYCSKECQKKNWKMHKDTCRSISEERARVELLAKTDAKAAACARDWISWRDHPSLANNTMLAFALGLHRSPARGRTHIVFRQVEYTPLGRDGNLKEDVRDRFEVVSVGVYRITDVYEDIQRLLGLDEGQGKVHVKELLEELDSLGEEELRATSHIIPILDLTFGKEIDASMGSAAMSINMLRNTPYNPDWRKRFNKSGRRATPMALKSGAKDAEHDF